MCKLFFQCKFDKEDDFTKLGSLLGNLKRLKFFKMDLNAIDVHIFDNLSFTQKLLDSC